MKKRLKCLIKKFFRVGGIDNILEFEKSSKVLTYLSPLINNFSYIPVTNWSADPIFISHICNDIVLNNRNSIVEFGSGISTILISRLIKINNLKINFYSVDHDQEWQNKIKIFLSNDHIDKIPQFIYSPISYASENSLFGCWYNKKFLSTLQSINFDLIIVDGPIGSTHKMVRYEALPFLLENLKKNFSIFLHDTDRTDELYILDKWSSCLDANFFIDAKYGLITNGIINSSHPQSSL